MLPSKSEIALIRSLKQKKGRDLHSLFVIEGEKMVEEARNNGVEIVKQFNREDIGASLMAKITHLTTPSPTLAIARRSDEAKVEWPEVGELYLALDRVSDPGNVGTIIRSAEWFGVKRLYLSEGCADIYNPKVLQASMGSLFKVQCHRVDFNTLFDKTKERGVPIYGTALKGENVPTKEPLPKGLVVLGSEAHGISEEYINQIERVLSIPSFSYLGTIDSLNVAVAAAIICWEISRSNL